MKPFKPNIQFPPLPFAYEDGAIYGLEIQIDSERLLRVLAPAAVKAKSGKTTALLGSIRCIAKKVSPQ